jgi:hypothetical protein
VFADACDKAREFTRPLVVSRLLSNGQCECSVGSFVVLNPEGWILTAWHIQQGIEELAQQVLASQQHDVAVAAIRADASLSAKEKSKKIRKVPSPDSKASRAFSPWWSWDGVRVLDAVGIPLPRADIMLGRLEPFDPTWIKVYPELKDAKKPLRQGTSLCRMGYPFPTTKATYDPQKGFVFDQGSLVLPVFPIEGILTRKIEAGHHPRGFLTGFLETSSPGLMGQSGGPIIDVQGAVWAIQSTTQHLSLGFNPQVPGGKANEKEHQFLNVGWGTHPETIAGLLDEFGVAYSLTAY